MSFKPATLLLAVVPLWAQDSLSLKGAVQLAAGSNKSIEAAAANLRAAETRIAQAHSGALPKVNYSESFQRGDNPVYVFSSLLTQHQFSAANFALGPLNRPDALNNFQSQLTVDQVVYDAGQTRHAVRSAELARGISGEDERRARMEVIAGVVRAYFGAILSAESLDTAREALRSAEADLHRAESVRAAGMSTDVDVLSIRVHLAAVNEQQIRRAADLDVARAALNDALGLPLDSRHVLATSLTPADVDDTALAEYEKRALASRPEARQAKLGADLAQNQAEAARGSMLPVVGVHAGFEADRQRFVNRGGANWIAAVSLKWNLFNGLADKSRIAEARFAAQGAQAQEQRAESGIRLQVRRAWADLRASQQRIEVARAAMAEAEESLRITQNRYEAGLSNVTDLLRNETARLESRTRYLAAVHDQRIAAVMLEFAAGTLGPDSAVLN